MKLARIKYESGSDVWGEGYRVEILTDDGWGLDTFYPLVRREGADENEEKNFVNFGILTKIEELRMLGYKFSVMC